METIFELSFHDAEHAKSFYNIVRYSPVISSICVQTNKVKIIFNNPASSDTVTDFVNIADIYLSKMNVYTLDDSLIKSSEDNTSSELAEKDTIIANKDAIIAKLEQKVKKLTADCESMKNCIDSLDTHL